MPASTCSGKATPATDPTVTVALALALPPEPVQVSVNVVVALSAPVDCEPLVAWAPLQPPEAVQLVALVELHVSVELLPLVTVVGLAVSVTVGTGNTVTVALALPLPPVPVQVNVYVVVAASAPVDCEPLVARTPLQPPEAVQLVALVELQVSVELPPLATLVGLAVSVTVGAGTIVTVALALPLPPVPVQVNVYVVVAASAPVDCEPLVALAPLQPPEAVQLVALVELQVSVEEPPFAMLDGLAVRVTVGVGTTVTVALALPLPPVPVQVSVNVVVAARAALTSDPLVVLAPLQPPEAVQLVALVELQVSVDVPPLATLVGFALKVTVGTGTTVTVTLWLTVPPVPLQLSEKPVVAASAPVDCDPLVALLPVQPPLAVQLVALVELQVSVEAAPTARLVGLALKARVGGGATVSVTLRLAVPLCPVQVNV